MKKAFLMVLACLLLAGCGAPSETVTPTDSRPDSALAETDEAAAESPPEPISTAPAESPPATAPAEPLSAPAVVTAGQAPEEIPDLSTWGARPRGGAALTAPIPNIVGAGSLLKIT